MADLDLLPTIDPPLADRAPSEEAPCADRGPDWIDAETAAEFGRQYAAGLLILPPEAGEVVAQTRIETLNELFARHLAETPLMARTPLPHRVYAMQAAIMVLCQAKNTGVVDAMPVRPSANQLTIAIGDMELYLASMRARLEQYMHDVDPALIDLVLTKAATVDADTLCTLTGLKRQQLATMRSNGIGPRFTKVPGVRQNIRYPIVAVLDWLYKEASDG